MLRSPSRTGYSNGEDVLGFTNQNNISGSFNASNGTLTLTGTASVANYQTALDSVTYVDNQHDVSTALRVVDFVVNDGINTSNQAVRDIDVLADIATKLVITSQPPASVTAGSDFAISVAAEDSQGNVVASFNGSETVALGVNPGSGVLGGTLTASATNGVASFSGLSLSSGGSGYTLVVDSGALTPATSNSFTVNQPPVITSSSSATVIAGSTGTFTVSAAGYPTATFSETGALPAGVTFNSTTGVLSASASTAVGSYPIEFTADNGSGSTATQAFVLNVAGVSLTLPDFGFETPSLGEGSFQYDPSGTAWTFAGHAGVAANASGFTSGNPNAPQGSQVAFIQNTGSVSQSLSLQPGTYMVSFDAAQRANISSNQTIDVLVDGNIVGVVTPTSTTYNSYSSAGFTITTAGMHTLTLKGVPPANDSRGGDYDTAFIDGVSISASLPDQPLDSTFNLQSLGSGSSAYQYDPTGSPWTFSGDAGLSGNASSFTAENPNAPQGSQVAFVQITGSVSQSFYIAPGVYDVNLLAAQRAIGPSDQTIEVLVDGQLVSTITPAGTSYASYTSGSFAIGTGGNHTLTLLGQDPLGGDNTAFVNQVAVQSVTANQPIDPGFESPDEATGQAAYQYDPTDAPWTFSGDAGVAGNGSSFTLGNPNSPQGSQAAFIQATGSASQMVTLAGGTYTISLDAANARRCVPSRPDCRSARRWWARRHDHAQRTIMRSIRPRRSTSRPEHTPSRSWDLIHRAATTRRSSTRSRFWPCRPTSRSIQVSRPRPSAQDSPPTNTIQPARSGRSAAMQA